MKKFKIIVSLLLIISLTGCAGQRQLNINEFLDKFNRLSSEALESEMFGISKEEYFVYSLLHGQNLLCLYCAKDGEIIQCTVTCKETSAEFEQLCVNIISTFTSLDTAESRKYFDSCGKRNGYVLTVNDYDIGTTMILNREDNPLNTNDYPTLKRYVDESDIARPTLSDTTTAIKQHK